LFYIVWEISTGRCLKTIGIGGIGRSVAWCPSQAVSLIAVAADRKVLLINPKLGDNLVVAKTDNLLEEPPEEDKLSKYLSINIMLMLLLLLFILVSNS
jgi:ribosome biogenesis protein ERB1